MGSPKGIEGTLTYRINQLINTVNTHTNLLKEMAPVLELLTKNSHPSVQFEECTRCHALVAPGKILQHIKAVH
jgi:hypothetical protein